MNDRPSNLETLRRGFETFERDGFDAWLAFTAETADPEIEVAPITVPGTEGGPLLVGVEAALSYLRQMNAEFPGLLFGEAELQEVGPDVIVVRHTIVSRDSGEAEPRRVSVVYAFRDGLVTSVFPYDAHENALRHAQEAADAEA